VTHVNDSFSFFCMRSRLLDQYNYNQKLFHVERLTNDWLPHKKIYYFSEVRAAAATSKLFKS